MKTQLTFTAENLSEQYTLQQMLRLDDYQTLLADFTEYLRQNHKYKDPPDDFDTIRETWFDMISDLQTIDF